MKGFETLPASKVKSLAVRVRSELADFKDSFKSNQTKDRSFADDVDDCDVTSAESSEYDDEEGLNSSPESKLNYENTPGTGSYMPKNTSESFPHD